MEDNLRCKICNSNSLKKFISFGKMPVSNAYLKKDDLDKLEFYYDMEVGFCEDCKMVQMINLVPYDKYIIPDEKGKTNYAFFSSTSKEMENHFAEIAKEIENKFLDSNSKVLETGSNDGIFLKNFKNNYVLGIEPSQNVAELAIKKNIPTITEFFNDNLARKIKLEKGKFRIIFSANVTLNIIDIHSYMEGVFNLLDERGVFITENPYLLDILENNSYDQIYDEHIWFFSLTSLSNIYSMHGLEIFDAERSWVHGGSIRVYASKPGVYKKTERLLNYLEEEINKNINFIEPYIQFSEKVKKNKEKFIDLLKNLKAQGKRIVGYAAASKGTIVQNYCNVGTNIIEYISDSTPFKQGLYTPGKHIPIFSPERFHEDAKNNNIDYAIIFAWNHKKEILEKEKNFLKNGGKFIIHLPEPHIIENNIFENEEEFHIDTTQKSGLIEGVEIKKINIFANDQGYLFEAIRSDDKIYEGKFGQILISEIYPGVIKGLHLHNKQTEYTTCIKGNIKYVAIKETEKNPIINTFIIGEKNPIIIKTPPGVWHGYMPLENKSATLVYLMDKPYNIKDKDTEEKDVFAFGDVWTVKNG